MFYKTHYFIPFHLASCLSYCICKCEYRGMDPTYSTISFPQKETQPWDDSKWSLGPHSDSARYSLYIFMNFTVI